MQIRVANSAVELSEEEIARYARHLITPEVGLAGQLKLKQAKVLQVGTGGLGSPIAIYLAAAGVGKLGLVDSDVVEVSNLQRQVLHGTSDIGRLKIDSARDALAEINPHVSVETYNTRFSRANALQIVKEYDIVVDGTDNLPTRYALNDACVLLGKPLVHASVFRFEGHITVFDAKRGPCYRCVHPEPPPPDLVQRLSVGGILGVQPGIAGCIQALEVIKLIVGKGKPLIGRMLIFDGVNLKFREVQIRKDSDCMACGIRPSLTPELMDYEVFCGVKSIPATSSPAEMTVTELKALLAERRPLVVIDVREPEEFAAGHIPGARSIPFGEILSHLHELTWGDEIVTYCRNEERSRQATEIFRKFNFRRSRFLAGGFPAWNSEQRPSPLT
jgi:molybdopterin/thiamine biosynthesis adenylyltransferase/rhodanese-related sulfurtransferase